MNNLILWILLVFINSRTSIVRFIISYGANYLIAKKVVPFFPKTKNKILNQTNEILDCTIDIKNYDVSKYTLMMIIK